MERGVKTQRVLLRTARWTATVAVIASAWLFGSADPWAYLLISQLIGLAATVWLFALVGSRRVELRVPVVTTILIALVTFTAAQRIPLPDGVIGIVSPLSAGIGREARALLSGLEAAGAAGGAAPATVEATLSLAPAATRRSLFLLIAYAGTFLIMANTIRHWRHLQHTGAALVFSAFVMSVLALVHKFSGSGEIYWFHAPRHGGDIFGPFTNRNHFSACMNMLFGAALGLFLASRTFQDAMGWPDWRERLAWLSSRRASRITLSGFAVVMTGGAACATLSRGGILSLAVAITVFGATLSLKPRIPRRVRTAGMALCLLVLGAALWLGRGQIMPRIGSLRDIARNPLADSRSIVTLDTLQILFASPLVGSGFGTFRHVFPMFQTPSLEYRWLHAHNDWAQLLAEGGAVGTGLFLALCCAWLLAVRRRFPTAMRRARHFVIGLLVGLGTIALHSFVDYSLHKPANALLLSALAGMAVAGVHLQREHVDNRLLPKRRMLGVRIAALMLLVGLTALILSQHRDLRGELAVARFVYSRHAVERATSLRDVAPAVAAAREEATLIQRFARDNPESLCDIAATFLAWSAKPGLDREARVTLPGTAAAAAALAVTAAPSDYLPWLWLARAQTVIGLSDEAERTLEQARKLVLRRREVRMFEARKDEGQEPRRVP